jgi:sugar (pentulose or hexulose) kinase
VLGFDLGTSQVKALLGAPDGTTAGRAALIAAAAAGPVPDASTTARSDENAEAIMPTSQLAESADRRFLGAPGTNVSLAVVSERRLWSAMSRQDR